MPVTPATLDDFLSLLGKSGLIPLDDLNRRLEQMRSQGLTPETPSGMAKALVQEGVLTPFHTAQLLAGKSRGFLLGSKYKVLERLGAGGMGAVFLCEHVVMRRLVAVKVLQPAVAESPSALERFHREARAAAQLDHPNIVRAHDVDHEGKLHFLVMEFVDGHTLDAVIRKSGPIDFARACHYIRQAAEGLQHAHEAGVVHRDIKPANLLLGRDGVLRILDMGLARFFHDSDDHLTRDHDANSTLGTADYMAPEQALGSGVDIRADLYSLGATFYFLLAGESPFAGRSTAQKLMMHQLLTPRRIRDIRPEVPQEIDDLIATLLEKDPSHRLQTPTEAAAALAIWTGSPIPLPDESEMPTWPPAIRALLRTEPASGSRLGPASTLSGAGSSKRLPSVPPPSQDDNGTRAESDGDTSTPEDEPAAGRWAGRGKPPASPAFQSASRVFGRNAPRRGKGPDTVEAALPPDTDQAVQTAPTEKPEPAPPPPRSRLVKWVGTSLFLLALVVCVALVWWQGLSRLNSKLPLELQDAGPRVEVKLRPPGPRPPPNPVLAPPLPQPQLPKMNPVKVLPGHGAEVESVCFCAEGRWLLSAGRDNTVRLWDWNAGNQLRQFLGHVGPVRGIAVLPDGRRFLTASADRTVRLWNLLTGEEIRFFAGHTGEVVNVACLPDGERFLSASKDHTIRLWNVDTGKELGILSGHQNQVFGLDVSLDGRYALSGGLDRTVRLWDVEQGKEIDRLNVAGPVYQVKFSTDGKQAVAGCGAEVWHWDLTANQVYPLDGPMGKITAAAFTASGRHILGASEDKTVHVWDTAQGRQHIQLVGHTGSVWHVATSPDGRHAASCGQDRSIRVYQLPNYTWGIYSGEIRELAGHTAAVEQVAFSADGRRLLSTSMDKTMCLWDVSTGKLLRRFEGHTDKVRGLVFLPDGKFGISASADKTARMWNLDTGEEMRRFNGQAALQWLSCSSDGRQMLSAGDDGFIRLWDVETGKELNSWKAHEGGALAVTFLPDGKRAASGGKDRKVKLWDLETRALLQERNQKEAAWRVEAAPRYPLVCSIDKSSIQLWDLETGKVRTLEVKSNGLGSAVFSPDGRHLMLGGHDGSVRLLEVASGKEVRKFEKHTDQTLGVCFSPDGRLGASGGRDKLIRLWQLPEVFAPRPE